MTGEDTAATWERFGEILSRPSVVELPGQLELVDVEPGVWWRPALPPPGPEQLDLLAASDDDDGGTDDQ